MKNEKQRLEEVIEVTNGWSYSVPDAEESESFILHRKDFPFLIGESCFPDCRCFENHRVVIVYGSYRQVEDGLNRARIRMIHTLKADCKLKPKSKKFLELMFYVASLETDDFDEASRLTEAKVSELGIIGLEFSGRNKGVWIVDEIEFQRAGRTLDELVQKNYIRYTYGGNGHARGYLPFSSPTKVRNHEHWTTLRGIGGYGFRWGSN